MIFSKLMGQFVDVIQWTDDSPDTMVWRFERQGNDIHAIVPVTVKEAYGGAEIDVPTIHGTMRAKIPPGTQGRQRFRLRSKGVKDPRTGGAGDHIYSVRVMIPKQLTRAGEDAATLLDGLYEGDVRADLPKGL